MDTIQQWIFDSIFNQLQRQLGPKISCEKTNTPRIFINSYQVDFVWSVVPISLKLPLNKLQLVAIHNTDTSLIKIKQKHWFFPNNLLEKRPHTTLLHTIDTKITEIVNWILELHTRFKPSQENKASIKCDHAQSMLDLKGTSDADLKLIVIETLEATAQKLTDSAASLRRSLACDDKVVEKIKAAICKADWPFYETALRRIANQPESQKYILETEWLNIPELDEIDAHHLGCVLKEKLDAYWARIRMYRRSSNEQGSYKLEFKSVEEIFAAINAGHLKKEALLSQLKNFADVKQTTITRLINSSITETQNFVTLLDVLQRIA